MNFDREDRETQMRMIEQMIKTYQTRLDGYRAEGLIDPLERRTGRDRRRPALSDMPASAPTQPGALVGWQNVSREFCRCSMCQHERKGVV